MCYPNFMLCFPIQSEKKYVYFFFKDSTKLSSLGCDATQHSINTQITP